mmetsp:Transcript_148583/g.211106  ORF Transcript_148583/g.211106 Transcript_148583/m.211106 type:complete len:101 (-) Transcript_148583:80-382(-)
MRLRMSLSVREAIGKWDRNAARSSRSMESTGRMGRRREEVTGLCTPGVDGTESLYLGAEPRAEGYAELTEEGGPEPVSSSGPLREDARRPTKEPSQGPGR